MPERSIRLLIGAPNLGPSSKVNKLCRLAREARHDLLVINDSDIRVTPSIYGRWSRRFEIRASGPSRVLYVGNRRRYVAGELESIGIATDFAAGVLAAVSSKA